MRDALLIITALVILSALWFFMGFVSDLFQAAHLREDMSAHKEKGSSVCSDSYSSQRRLQD